VLCIRAARGVDRCTRIGVERVEHGQDLSECCSSPKIADHAARRAVCVGSTAVIIAGAIEV